MTRIHVTIPDHQLEQLDDYIDNKRVLASTRSQAVKHALFDYLPDPEEED